MIMCPSHSSPNHRDSALHSTSAVHVSDSTGSSRFASDRVDRDVRESDSVDADSMDPDTLVRDISQLRYAFESGCKSTDNLRIGIEAECFGVHGDSRSPLMYEGKNDIQGLFEDFEQHFGWIAKSETPGAPNIALQRGACSITLEPAGQFEFSGSPQPTVHEVEKERQAFINELQQLSRSRHLVWIASGFHPLATHEQLGWVPKLRYGIMRMYLASQGVDALEMMRRTATIQANLDFCSIDDAIRKLCVSLRLTAIVSAIFANGPLVEGKRYGGKSRRISTWLHVDADRQGLIPEMWKKNAKLDDYIEWVLEAPMFMFMRGNKVIRNTGQRFRDFMKAGFQGHSARYRDWLTHLNTMFPEVRLKGTLELRGADAVPGVYAPALPALWTGLLYDDASLEQATRWSADWTYEQMMQLREDVARDGLNAQFKGRRVAYAAEKLFGMALDGLQARKRLDASQNTEAVHVQNLGRLVQRGWCPADEVLAKLAVGELTFERIMHAMQL